MLICLSANKQWTKPDTTKYALSYNNIRPRLYTIG